ncbi:helix-turn-helix transcriptional regulator [Lysinibacillus sphaericus]|uniref:helix-turn-helix transcriptional regulator n=1 Tax=Lysinibacillus sphaericus TaxID=1421 RepID=UPI0005677C11|nr:helix-turn-helix transcriptional regulator [Lysinibacillus sphaericus]
MTGEQLKKLRETLVMTQKEFAELVGVGCSTISNIESGARTMSLLTRAKIIQKIQSDETSSIFADKT